MKLKRWQWSLVLFVLFVASLCLLVTNPARARSFPHALEVDPEILRQDTESLLAVGEWRNIYNPEILDKAADFIRGSWQQTGFEVVEQVFDVEGRDYRNLSITYGPTTGARIVIGAHYDVCMEQAGADDNASSVVAILELARLLKKHQPRVEHPIELVAYTLEEPPAFRGENMGSAVHAAALVEQGVEIKAMIALDMIGYYDDQPGSQHYPIPLMSLLYGNKANYICVVGNLGGRGLVRQVKSRMKGAAAIPVRSINAPERLPGIDFSDHLNFWKHGYPAVLISDTSFYRNDNYHRSGDTIETLDHTRIAEVVKGLYAVITTL